MDQIVIEACLVVVVCNNGTNVSFVRYHMPGRGSFRLEHVSRSAYAKAADTKRAHLESRAESWRQFVAKQIHNGAAITHRLARRDCSPCFDTATVRVGATRAASPQQILQQDLAARREIWCRLGETLTAPWRQVSLEHSLPPITAEQVRRAALTFKKATSVRCDAFPLRSIATLSDQLREAIADFLNAVE